MPPWNRAPGAGSAVAGDTREELLAQARAERQGRQDAKNRQRACVLIQKSWRGHQSRCCHVQRVRSWRSHALNAKHTPFIDASYIALAIPLFSTNTVLGAYACVHKGSAGHKHDISRRPRDLGCATGLLKLCIASPLVGQSVSRRFPSLRPCMHACR